jgi:hypothetical protein
MGVSGMKVFISYSRHDEGAVRALVGDLQRARVQVWLDEDLGGGESWWRDILGQILTCEVFIVALSDHSLDSKPCQAELRYAQDLNRPILPVQIGPVNSLRANPLASVQLVDYRNPTSDASIKLITAVHELLAQQTPLPEPLPEQPPVPYEYLMWLAATMRDAELSAAQQAKLVAELKSGLEEDGNDPWARGEIMRLWRELRDRSDVTYETGTERQSGVRRLLRPVMWVGLLVAAVAVVAVVAWAIDGHALALIFTASVIGMVLALSALIWWRLERSNAHPADASQLPPVRPPLPPVPPPPVFETEPDRAPGASGTGPQPSPLQPPLASEAAEDVPGDRLI